MLFAQIAREIWSFEVRSQRESKILLYFVGEREGERERYSVGEETYRMMTPN